MSSTEDSHVVAVKPGAYVYRQGDAADAAFVIESGAVVLTTGGGADEEARERLGPGDVFGESALGRDTPRVENAVADGETVLLRIAPEAYIELVSASPAIAAAIVGRLSERLARVLTMPAKPAKRSALPTEKVSGEKPRLVHASGAEFALPLEGVALVGRADPHKGFTPHVELSELDAQRSLSRKHARLFCEQNVFHVQEEGGVRNGTFVNGRRVKSGERVTLVDGDEVAFGLIKTTFRLR